MKTSKTPFLLFALAVLLIWIVRIRTRDSRGDAEEVPGWFSQQLARSVNGETGTPISLKTDDSLYIRETFSHVEKERYYSTIEEVVAHENIATHWFFHYTHRLSDGTPVGTYGALTHILDGQGDPISPGFHYIYPTPDGYIGGLGARLFRLDKRGQPLVNAAYLRGQYYSMEFLPGK